MFHCRFLWLVHYVELILNRGNSDLLHRFEHVYMIIQLKISTLLYVFEIWRKCWTKTSSNFIIWYQKTFYTKKKLFQENIPLYGKWKINLFGSYGDCTGRRWRICLSKCFRAKPGVKHCDTQRVEALDFIRRNPLAKLSNWYDLISIARKNYRRHARLLMHRTCLIF